MTTTLNRIQVTVTEEVAAALALARQRWPQSSKSELMARLAVIARSAMEDEAAQRRAIRRRAIDQAKGSFRDTYPDGYLDDLRADWPQ